MKKSNILITIFFIIICFVCKSQMGSIVNISISPVNPTINDTIYVYADLSFSSTPCILQNSYHTVVNNNIVASSIHCIPALSLPAFCSITDTFKINPLSAGFYNFILSISSGIGGAPGPPCTPGFVADDLDTLLFEVVSPTGIKYSKNDHLDIEFYPNPNQGLFHYNISKDIYQSTNMELQIFSNNGKKVFSNLIRDRKGIISLDLESGIYFVRLRINNESISTMNKLLIIR